MATTIEISGIEEIERKLKTLDQSTVRSIFRRNLRNALKIIRDAARFNLPKRTGLLQRSVKIKNAKGTPFSTSVVVTTGEKADQMNTGKAWYGHLVEHGWDITPLKERKRQSQKRFFAMLKSGEAKTPTGKKTVPGKYYIERTYNANSSSVASQIEQGIVRDIEQAMENPYGNLPLFSQGAA